ncbi:MAG: hypothetical protein JSU03_08585 [Bacteroidetes bacterium]|nr:hypothetical protein [Bacteroidota bacterium]MBS1757320.1 hypothetical protein [Bacteroidota bacterium]
MKRLLIIITAICLVQLSCKKNNWFNVINNTLDGKWKMVVVKDNATGQEMTKPDSVKGDVEITFVTTGPSSGSFSGHTLVNSIDGGSYTTGSNHTISIKGFSMTQIYELPWADFFTNNFGSAYQYSFTSDGKLTVVTAIKTLVFLRE